MLLVAGMVDFLRAAVLAAIPAVVPSAVIPPAVMLSAVRAPAQDPVRMRFLVRLPVRVSLRGASTVPVVHESEATASRTTAAVTVVSVTDIPTGVSMIRTGGGIRIRRSTMTSNTRLAWPTR